MTSSLRAISIGNVIFAVLSLVAAFLKWREGGEAFEIFRYILIAFIFIYGIVRARHAGTADEAMAEAKWGMRKTVLLAWLVAGGVVVVVGLIAMLF